MPYELFKPFGADHVWTLVLILPIWLFCAWLGFKKKNMYLDKIFRWSLALGLLLNDFGTNAKAFQLGDWKYSWALPLHLCDLSLYAVVIALIFRYQTIWELAYYWGLGGSLVAVLTPDIPASFPHYYYISFFIHHAGIIAGVLYLGMGCRYTLPQSSIKRVWFITNAYALIIACFNWLMETNYLFLCKKPIQPSILDFFGPWPIYLISMEVLFTASLLLLYWLFQLKQRVFSK